MNSPSRFEVSVIIPLYNAAKYVREAVFSALQHNEVKEVIIVEDGSSDNSSIVAREIVEEFPHKVRLYSHKGNRNLGAGPSRNLGIKMASCEFVTFLDADDVYTSIRFEKEKQIFLENEFCDGVYGCFGVKNRPENTDFENTTVSSSIDPEELFNHLTGLDKNKSIKGYFHLATLTLKRDQLMKSRIVFPKIQLHQDTVFIWMCSLKLRLYTGEFINPLGLRRIHQNNRIFNITDRYYTNFWMYNTLNRLDIPRNARKSFIERQFNCLSGIKKKSLAPFFAMFWIDPFGFIKFFLLKK